MGEKKEEEVESEEIIAVSPKLPPPNPIEVMSKEERQKQKENTQILEIFQDFEDNMAQYDEEIDFKQSFAESIVSQIMELAENNKVISAPKYAKRIDAKCRLVINAAKAHSQALQTFNQMLQNIYSQMEQEEDSSHITPGGPSGNLDGGGLPQRLPSELMMTEPPEQDDQKEDKLKVQSGGLPRYQSASDLTKTNEPEKKVAKALFDYPGGYRSNELTFHRGTSLIITKEKEGWVYGYYELEPSLTGWFPKSYVKIISG